MTSTDTFSFEDALRADIGEDVKLRGEDYEVAFEWMHESGVNINHFIVTSNRRSGVGSGVMETLVKGFRNAGADYVVLNMKGGDAAESFAKSNGFEVVIRERDRITAELEFDS